MIDPHHIWNVIYNARSNKRQPPTSANTAPATQNEPHDWSASHMKRHLQCAEQQASPSNFTKYCACHAKWVSWLTRSHMKRHLQCAERQESPSDLTKYCACHAKWISWLLRVTYETLLTMRGATVNTLQPHQILRLPRKMTAPNPTEICWKQLKRNFQCAADPRMIRPWSENDPTMSRSVRNPPRNRGYFSHSPGADSIENYNVSRSSYHSKFHLMLRLPRKVTHELHQMLRLPRKMNLMIDPHRICNVIYNARSKRHHPPTSPNTAPATQNESHDWSRSHMKRHVQCAEQQESPSHFTKYCACHAKWISWLLRVTYETLLTMRGATVNTLQPHQILRLPRKMTAPNPTEICWKQLKRNFHCAADPRMIRPWSENDPTMNPSVRNPPRNRGYFSHSPGADSIENYNVSRSSYHSKFHLMLRLPRKVTHELHQMLRLPRKMNLMIDPHHIWNVIYNAWSNRHHPPTAPNTAPATQNECHDWSCSPMKRHFQCAEQQESPSHFTKYCACHAKWISCLIRITYETSFPMRGATGINLQPHQILRLPRKIALPNLKEINWKQLKWHF